MNNPIPTFTAFFKAIFKGAQNRYEAAVTTWGNRRYLFSNYQDARFDVTHATSMEICRKHKDLVQNTPYVGKIRDLKIQFAVGSDGLVPIPNASDAKMDKGELEQINAAYGKCFAAWWKSPELGSNLSGPALTKQWEGLYFDVGNIIIYKTHDERGFPKIQTIDRLRLQTPPDLQGDKTIIDGIRLSQITIEVIERGEKKTRVKLIGKPKSYFIRDEFEMNVFDEIPAEHIIHKFEAISPGQMVGIPKGTVCINKIIDYTDLHILEMTAQKEAAQASVVETNTTGELSPNAARRVPLRVQTTNAAGNPTEVIAPGFYSVSRGTSKIAMKIGDKMENFQIKRPDPCQQNYWDLTRSEICMGYNVPKLLVEPYSLQGTVTRADLDVSGEAFRNDFEVIKEIIIELYAWFMAWAVRYDMALGKQLGTKRPENYLECTVMPPRSPNVDIGYTADALAKEMEMGIKSFQRACAERNLDWRVVLRENAKFQAEKKRIAEEYGVDPESISFFQFTSGPEEEQTQEAA